MMCCRHWTLFLLAPSAIQAFQSANQPKLANPLTSPVKHGTKLPAIARALPPPWLFSRTSPSSTSLFGVFEDFMTGTDESLRTKENTKYLAKLQERVDRINALEPRIEDLGDDELKAKSTEFRERLRKGEDLNGPLLEEAFAVVREASWYVGYDVDEIKGFGCLMLTFFISCYIGAYWNSVITTSSLSVGLFSMTDGLQKWRLVKVKRLCLHFRATRML
jgi:hypothetical protein